MGDDADRSAMIQAAEEEGVTALLWESLSSVETGDGDAILRNEITPSVRGAATRELLVQMELRRILERLAREHVRALVIKGTALAYTVYGSAWHRPRDRHRPADRSERNGKGDSSSGVLRLRSQ